MLRLFAVVAACVVPGATSLAQSTPAAFINARIITITGDTIDGGTLVVHDGEIVAVGDGVVVPRDADVYDAAGLTIMPGLVDTHSHIGGIGAADGSGPIQPGVRVFDSINPRSSGFKRALAGGLTTLNIMPGSGHLSSGQTVYAKLRWADGPPTSVDDIAVRDDSGAMMGGLKMANGTNSIRPGGANGFPGTRGKSAYLVRERFLKAQEYRDAIERAGDDASKLPARDLGLEALVEVMSGSRIVHHHTHRADDIMTVLRLADEFGFRVVLHHVSEAWVVADEIAAYEGVDGPDGEPWGAPCSIILIDSPGGKLEAASLILETGGVLEKAGAQVAIHTDDWITDSRLFLRYAALAVRAGMSREAALRALTIEGARMLDMGDRVGSLEVGKDADFVLLSGYPLALDTRVLQTWVEGELAFDLSDEDDRLYAEGGLGAAHDIQPYFCCYDHLIQGSGH